MLWVTLALHQHFTNDARGFDAGQLRVEAAEAVREALVIDAECVQNRCVEIAHLDRVLDNVVREVVGLSVLDAALHAAAREDRREATTVVIAA